MCLQDVFVQNEPELSFAADGYPAPRSRSADGDALAIFKGGLLLVWDPGGKVCPGMSLGRPGPQDRRSVRARDPPGRIEAFPPTKRPGRGRCLRREVGATPRLSGSAVVDQPFIEEKGAGPLIGPTPLQGPERKPVSWSERQPPTAEQ
jgi:hypothetical protein